MYFREKHTTAMLQSVRPSVCLCVCLSHSLGGCTVCRHRDCVIGLGVKSYWQYIPRLFTDTVHRSCSYLKQSSSSSAFTHHLQRRVSMWPEKKPTYKLYQQAYNVREAWFKSVSNWTELNVVKNSSVSDDWQGRLSAFHVDHVQSSTKQFSQLITNWLM